MKPPTLHTRLLIAHGLVGVAVGGAALFARWRGLGFETFALPPLSLIELAMREIQAHPEEGIHVLARVQLPATAGALHLLMLALWAAAVPLALRLPGPLGTRALLALFPLAMLQDTAFLTLEHVALAALVQAIYVAALVATLCAHGSAALRAPALLLALLWLVVRTTTDILLPEGTALLAVETFAGLAAPALWITYLAGVSSPDAAKE